MLDNYGLLIKDKSPSDWIAGSFSPLEHKVLQANGQWDGFLPLTEYQNQGFETMACVSFSALNCLETIYKRQKGVDRNFSDRFTAKMSGTTSQGNYQFAVAESIKKQGVVDEASWPFAGLDWNDFYSDIPISVQNEGLEFLTKYNVFYEWVNQESIKTHLAYGPLQVTVKYMNGNGILNPIGNPNHAVTLYGYEEDHFKIFDSYNNVHKKYSLNYQFGGIMLFTLAEKTASMFIPLDNELYMLVEGPEQKLAMGLGGKLVIYDQKIDTLINSASRSKKYLVPKPITLAQWNSVIKVNGKGQVI